MPADACVRCGTALGPAQLDCPSCHALVHGDRLKALAVEADAHRAAARDGDALETYREMLALLPASTRQHAQIAERVAALEAAPSAGTAPAAAPRREASGLVAAGGAVLLALSKAKAFVPMVLTMAVSFAAYWGAYGWQFAAGLVISIWVHEMGHVLELKRCGVRASLPMFIPGIGAFVRLQQATPEPHVDARIGIAGPIAGALACGACLVTHLATGVDLWLGLAKTGAIINLFNLTPLFVLDGSRAFHAMSQAERALVTLAFAAALAASGNAMLWLPLLGAVTRVFARTPRGQVDWAITGIFLGLVASLTAVAAL